MICWTTFQAARSNSDCNICCDVVTPILPCVLPVLVLDPVFDAVLDSVELSVEVESFSSELDVVPLTVSALVLLAVVSVSESVTDVPAIVFFALSTKALLSKADT